MNDVYIDVYVGEDIKAGDNVRVRFTAQGWRARLYHSPQESFETDQSCGVAVADFQHGEVARWNLNRGWLETPGTSGEADG